MCGLYENRAKVARELATKLEISGKMELTQEKVNILVAQIVANYGLPKKAAKELVDAHIVLGNIVVVE